MQDVIEKCEELLARFDEKAPLGHRWHTPTRQDFIELAACSKAIAQHVQKLEDTGVEID